MTTPHQLLFASHNTGKVAEVADILRPYDIEVISAKDLQLPEPEETETTFIGNARIKARAAQSAGGLAVLADDSGLSVDALDGAPGVYTADWAETGSGRDFGIAMQKVEDLLAAKGPNTDRSAQFRATLVFLDLQGQERVYEGIMPGHLVWPPRGQTGHGYDPVFVPEGHDITFGEMDPMDKNAMSHRRRALDLFMKDVESGDLTF